MYDESVYDESVTVMLEGVKVIRETDDTLFCLINGALRFIPRDHVRGVVPKPTDVGALTIPRWLADILDLP